MSLFLRLSGISLGQYYRKSLAKSGGFVKKIRGGDGYVGGGLSFERGVQIFITLCSVKHMIGTFHSFPYFSEFKPNLTTYDIVGIGVAKLNKTGNCGYWCSEKGSSGSLWYA